MNWRKIGEVARGFGRGASRAGRVTVRAGRGAAGTSRKVGRGAAGATRSVGRATRRLTHAGGAGRTGLGRLIEVTAAHSAGDALITVALAGTLFFGLPVDEARGHVALYLLITMVPFAVLAPFVGPVLDRFRSGRRYVMAGTLFARGLLCFAMAAAVRPGDVITLFPAALGVLVLSKAYNVSRAAIMPSVLPANTTLVTANARVALFSLVTAGVALPIGAGLVAWLGAEWVLRGAMVLFLVLGVQAVRLPRHIDSPDLEEAEVDEEGAKIARWRTLLRVGPVVSEALRANAAIRVFSGFLLFYLLFLVQDKHLPGLPAEGTIALLAVAAGAGGLAGAAAASLIRARSPQIAVLASLGLCTATAAVAAYLFGLWAGVAVALVAAFAQELGKLALDAIVQREIGEEVRSSTFGVVEALLQLGWVLGGVAGLVMSLLSRGPAGLAGVAAVTGLTLAWLLIARRLRLSRSRGSANRRTARSRVHGEDVDNQPTVERTKPLANPFG
ncbi:Major Facilitator Superfamily protein [Sinosporangium album]|uniref:Major Facilitator Superfamily protein n=1 Tax=Sinosporangium album TaxID=504805 RepID=A0A1G8CJD8_9ACTN|nr:MFS transporter [Sinosporangium album]SDH45576.1 Major Facilitator Superfamily protein [Sinosporangium album]